MDGQIRHHLSAEVNAKGDMLRLAAALHVTERPLRAVYGAVRQDAADLFYLGRSLTEGRLVFGPPRGYALDIVCLRGEVRPSEQLCKPCTLASSFTPLPLLLLFSLTA